MVALPYSQCFQDVDVEAAPDTNARHGRSRTYGRWTGWARPVGGPSVGAPRGVWREDDRGLPADRPRAPDRSVTHHRPSAAHNARAAPLRPVLASGQRLAHRAAGLRSRLVLHARERNFVAPALPFLRRLRDQTRETANLGVVESGEIVLVNQVQSREIIRAISPGGRALADDLLGHGQGVPRLLHARRTLSRCSGGTERVAPPARRPKRRGARGPAQRRPARRLRDRQRGVRPGTALRRCTGLQRQGGGRLRHLGFGPRMRMIPERLPVLGRQVARAACEITAALGGRPHLPLNPSRNRPWLVRTWLTSNWRAPVCMKPSWPEPPRIGSGSSGLTVA